MPSFEDIADFIRAEIRSDKPITPDTRIVEDLNCYGDDFGEFLDNYSQKFHVNISNCLWYFHNIEEPFLNFGSLLFPPPYKRVKRIAITARMLKDFADTGTWNISYSQHEIPKHRLDIYFTWLVSALLIAGLLYSKYLE